MRNEKEMLDDYIARFLEFNHLNTGAKYTLLEYDMPDEFNQTADEFMKYVWKHGMIIRDHGLSKLYKRSKRLWDFPMKLVILLH